MEWYYVSEQHQRMGPVSESEFQTLIAKQVITEETLVWASGMTDWQSYGEMRAAAGQTPLEAVADSTGEMNFGGFWIRAGAKIIDSIILTVLTLLINVPFMFLGASAGPDQFSLMAFQGLSTVVNLIVGMVYTTWFLGKFAATPGKMACGLKVVTADAGRVSYARALGRHFAEMLSGILIGIGYLMIAFDRQKRGLHDHICGTRVIYKNK